MIPAVLTVAGAAAIHAAWRRASTSATRVQIHRIAGWLLLLAGLAVSIVLDGAAVGLVRWLMLWQCAALAAPVVSARWRRDAYAPGR